MMYKITGNCAYCAQKTDFLLGVSKASWRKKIIVTGETCKEHVTDALNIIGGKAFGTTYWPAVANLSGDLIYHSFGADQEKLSYSAGWKEYLSSKTL